MAGCAPATAPATASPKSLPSLTPPLVGRWRVVGCETSPDDPADCARGEIVFTAHQVTIAVPAGETTTMRYRVVSGDAHGAVVDAGGTRSAFVIDDGGAAYWMPPGLGGRVGTLSLVRSVTDREGL